MPAPDPEGPHLTGDAAKRAIADDEFGLDKITDSITSVLLSRISADGYAIGIEGEWGSGKSSLINFISEALAEHKHIHRVIRFDPWLVGTKEALLASLFNILISEIREFDREPKLEDKLATNPGLVERTVGHLSRYAAALEQGSAVLDYAAAFDPTGKTKLAVLALRVLSFLATRLAPKEVSLERLKDLVKGDLRTLENLVGGLRLTVVIDDLDRLDPTESVEILRLVRAVADLPTITYLICFDRDVLAEHVSDVIGVEDGHGYIEKIFQTFLPLPPQEPFALRRFVRKLLNQAFPEEMQFDASSDRDRMAREQLLFDTWIGKFVETPRDAIRLCEAVKLGWPYLRDRADFIDYIWLQLIKLQCHPLYRWVRDYLVNIGSYRDAGRAGDQEPKDEATKLIGILKPFRLPIEYDRIGISEFLPGTRHYAIEDDPKVFQLENGELDRFESGRRLGSPSHWRLYFSFDAPSYALDDDLLVEFRRASASDRTRAIQILRELIARPHDRPTHYFQVFLERIFDRKESLSGDEQIGLAWALAEVMDEVNEPLEVRFGLEGPWRRALRLLGPSVASHFADIVRSAASVNWLADVVRDQGFALGVISPERVRPERQWLSKDEFPVVLHILLNRFRAMGIEEILRRPQPLEILFCWQQLGDTEELKKELSIEKINDRLFLELLEALRTPVSSSAKGFYKPLRSEMVAHFLDSDAAKSRLSSLAESGGFDDQISAHAIALLRQWEDERD